MEAVFFTALNILGAASLLIFVVAVIINFLFDNIVFHMMARFWNSDKRK